MRWRIGPRPGQPLPDAGHEPGRRVRVVAVAVAECTCERGLLDAYPRQETRDFDRGRDDGSDPPANRQPEPEYEDDRAEVRGVPDQPVRPAPHDRLAFHDGHLPPEEAPEDGDRPDAKPAADQDERDSNHECRPPGRPRVGLRGVISDRPRRLERDDGCDDDDVFCSPVGRCDRLAPAAEPAHVGGDDLTCDAHRDGTPDEGAGNGVMVDERRHGSIVWRSAPLRRRSDAEAFRQCWTSSVASPLRSTHMRPGASTTRMSTAPQARQRTTVPGARRYTCSSASSDRARHEPQTPVASVISRPKISAARPAIALPSTRLSSGTALIRLLRSARS